MPILESDVWIPLPREYLHAAARWVERRLVRPDIESIFAFRREALLMRFG